MSGLDIEGALAGHFVMWRDLDGSDQPPGEWFCSCGLKFGFSDTAIAHVAAVLREQIAAWLTSEAVLDAAYETLDPEGYGWAAGDGPSVKSVLATLAALVAPSRVPGEET